MEIGLDATRYVMALTSCFAKIGTFYNAEGATIIPLFSPSTVVGVIVDAFRTIVVDVPTSTRSPPPTHWCFISSIYHHSLLSITLSL